MVSSGRESGKQGRELETSELGQWLHSEIVFVYFEREKANEGRKLSIFRYCL